jgi:hypothetical protein
VLCGCCVSVVCVLREYCLSFATVHGMYNVKYTLYHLKLSKW